MASGTERLLEFLKQHSLLHGDFTLSSGLKSKYYFDGRMSSLHPEGAYLIGKEIFDRLKDAGVDAVGGLTMGADPIVASVAVVSHLEGQAMPAFIVRDEQKEHGTQKRIEGLLPKGSRVAIVDDVLTTGGSVKKAIEAAEAAGCRVVKVIVLVDRHQGGSDELRQRYDLEAIFDLDIMSGELTIAGSSATIQREIKEGALPT